MRLASAPSPRGPAGGRHRLLSPPAARGRVRRKKEKGPVFRPRRGGCRFCLFPFSFPSARGRGDLGDGDPDGALLLLIQEDLELVGPSRSKRTRGAAGRIRSMPGGPGGPSAGTPSST